MKNDLTCGVVRDLLPSYVEGLTAPETNEAVERHLSDCADCERLRTELASRDVPGAPEEVKEVDYLKKVRRRGRRRVMIAVAVTVLILALGIAAKLFLIGSPAIWDNWENPNWTAYTNVPNQLDIRLYSEFLDTADCNWNVTNENGIVRVSARKVLPSVFHDTSDHWEHISLNGVREVWVSNQLVWQGGVMISPQIDRVYQAKTPYVGNAPAVGRVVSAAGFNLWGDYTMELQTSAQPYRLTLRYSSSFTPEGMESGTKDIFQDMAATLVAIGNLDEIECAFQGDNDQSWSYVLTVEELNQALPQIVSAYNERFLNQKDCPLYASVKDYGDSCADLDQLYDAMWWAIELGAYTPQVQS